MGITLKAVWMRRELGHDVNNVSVIQLNVNTAD